MENSQEKVSFSEKAKAFFGKWGGLIACALAIIAIAFLFAPNVVVETKYYIGDEKVKEYFAYTIIDLVKGGQAWAYFGILGMVVIGAISNVIGSFVEKAKKNSAVASTLLYVLAIMMIFIGREVSMNVFYSTIEHFNDLSVEWGSAAFIVSSALAAFMSLSSADFSGSATTQAIAEDGVLIAAAFVLNFIKLFAMPTGGSVNFQMLPLMIIALRRGPLHGLVSGGLVYGLLTCITDGYGLYTFPFDYLVGFGSVAVMGFFSGLILNKDANGYNLKGELFILVGGVLATLVRLVGGMASSMVFYETGFFDSFIYNIGYVGISGLLAIAVLMALYGPLARTNKTFPAK